METVLVILTSSWAVAGATIAFAWKSDELFSIETRQRLSNHIRNLNIYGMLREWPRHFVEWFDQIFGKRYLSIRFISASILLWLSAFTILTISWAALNPGQLSNYLINPLPTWLLAINILACGILNYFSLIKTRILFGAVPLSPRLLNLLGVVVIEISLSIAIFMLSVLFMLVLLLYLRFWSVGESYPLDAAYRGYGIMLYSIFVSSRCLTVVGDQTFPSAVLL